MTNSKSVDKKKLVNHLVNAADACLLDSAGDRVAWLIDYMVARQSSERSNAKAAAAWFLKSVAAIELGSFGDAFPEYRIVASDMAALIAGTSESRARMFVVGMATLSKVALPKAPTAGVKLLSVLLYLSALRSLLTKAEDSPAGKSGKDLFLASDVLEMATPSPLWEGANILTQNRRLLWSPDEYDKLRYTASSKKWTAHFWVTENGFSENPLASDAAMEALRAFDGRAAAMHMLYSVYAMGVKEPWRDEFVIEDDYALRAINLDKRNDLTRAQKLKILHDCAARPSQIMILVHLPSPLGPHRGRNGGITIQQSRLWEIDFDFHGARQRETAHGVVTEWTGLTIRGRAGRWAQTFLNREGAADGSALFQYGFVSLPLLQSIASRHAHRPGVANLATWLTYKARVGPNQAVTVRTLMDVAYGEQRIQDVSANHKLRGRLAETWDNDLQTLADDGWSLDFDAGRYPMEIRPKFAGGGLGQRAERPNGYWDRMLQATLVIRPPESLRAKSVLAERLTPPKRRRSSRATERGEARRGL